MGYQIRFDMGESMKTAIIIAGAIAALASQAAQAQSAGYYARQPLVGMVKAETVPVVKRTCATLVLFKNFTAAKTNITTKTDTTLAQAAALCSAIPNVTACFRNSYSGVWYTTETDPLKIRLNSDGVDYSASVCT
jgi:hypothetical protein